MANPMKSNLPQIKSKALDCGFSLFGVADAFVPEKDKENILTWVEQGLAGKMDWYSRNQDLRLNLNNLGFTPRSVIVLGALYQDRDYEEVFADKEFKISRYATGKDYHKVLKKMSDPLLKYLRDNFPENKFRQGVDSLPVPEKVFAREAGIGWQGKNTNIINEDLGSYFFLSVILTDLQLLADKPVTDRCGTCRACLDACPTGALFEPYKIDAGKCISHHTIEDRSDFFSDSVANGKWVYGCDICQEVCPWNRVKAKKREVYTLNEEFKLREEFKTFTKKDFLEMTEEEFKEFVKDSAMDRITLSMWKRNFNVL
jgi:epoxyqueuosine reductase